MIVIVCLPYHFAKALCFALRRELTEYYRLVAVLENQLDASARRAPPMASIDRLVAATDGIGDTLDVPSADVAGAGDGTRRLPWLTLRQLVVWVQEPLARMRKMAVLCAAADGLVGGALASALHAHTRHGDPFVRGFVGRIMVDVCAPLFAMVRRWCAEGAFFLSFLILRLHTHLVYRRIPHRVSLQAN